MQSSKELTRELSDPNFNALNETSSVITSIQSIPAISSEENQSQITSTLVNKKCSQICEQRPIHFDYQAHIKKIVLSIKGDTKHYDGLEVSEALMQMPFITFDTAVVKVSDFISFAKKNAVEVNNLAELKGKSIQVMHGESEIMVIKISGKKDSLIWWGNDDNHQT